ncbi:uncharacterized protein TRUGW13939_04791 [Talaromyces rugulosus]|uniref:Uncharacterized protein n=1 Tax=Talaromyces rugulosus TaxID=121627 RepID=A0A7H8QY43_TALRU|nr:uncharacterized protein TRUGW13939_04791 [Talaromyces rugulosus]QKX57673.1 hypothetical protein TRUGW13939_04791 [Talaromyces rugulosus]
MASADQQYLNIKIQDKMRYDIRLENVKLRSGEFYVEGNKNDVLTTDDVGDGSIRHNNGIRHICACGENGSISGPQGSFDLVDDLRDVRICTLTWAATMEPGRRNSFVARNVDPRYNVDVGKWNDSGIMGDVPVAVDEM